MANKSVLSKVMFLVAVLSLLFFVGCAKPPTAEMEKAEKAIAGAKEKEANLYAEEAFKKAEAALQSAKDLVGGKKYKEAKAAAEQAATLANQSLADVETNKAKMKTDAEQMLTDIQKEMENVKGQMVAAIKKKIQVNREEVQAAIGKWEVQLTAAKGELGGGKIRDAKDKLMETQAQLKTQVENLTKALEAAPAAPEKKK